MATIWTCPPIKAPVRRGMDLASAVDRQEPVTIEAAGRAGACAHGISIASCRRVSKPRSGRARALPPGTVVTVLNTPGTIDADYRGEIKVILINHGAEPFTVARGERIAQLVVQPVARVTWDERDALSSSARGEGGFGSKSGR